MRVEANRTIHLCSPAGYSYLTNQYGLATDNVAGFELVLPEGKVVQVSQDSYPDLFWGLKVRGLSWPGVVALSVLMTLMPLLSVSSKIYY